MNIETETIETETNIDIETNVETETHDGRAGKFFATGLLRTRWCGPYQIPYTTPYTLYRIPYTLYPIPFTLYPMPHTLYPRVSTPSPTSQTLNCKP